MTEPRKLKVSWAESKTSWVWEVVEGSWRAITRSIATAKVGSKDTAGCWSPAVFKDKRRGKHNANHIDLLVYDSDCGNTKEELAERLRANGWKGCIVSTSSHLTNRTNVQASAFEKWKEGKGDGEDVSLEAFLIEKKHLLPRVVAGAKEIRRFPEEKFKGKILIKTEMIEIEHQPCPKYRVILLLSRPWRVEDYPNPETSWRAWENAYIAVADKLGLPFDETYRGVDRMFFFTRVSADRLALAESLEVEGADCPALDLPPSDKAASSDDAASSDKTAKHHTSRKREHREHKQRSFKPRVIIDSMTGTKYQDLMQWARDIGPHFQLADALRERGEVLLDDRGNVDGKLHIECPFDAEHTSSADGGTFVVNTGDREKAKLKDLAPGFVIHCSHNACHDRDRLEFIEEIRKVMPRIIALFLNP